MIIRVFCFFVFLFIDLYLIIDLCFCCYLFVFCLLLDILHNNIAEVSSYSVRLFETVKNIFILL